MSLHIAPILYLLFLSDKRMHILDFEIDDFCKIPRTCNFHHTQNKPFYLCIFRIQKVLLLFCLYIASLIFHLLQIVWIFLGHNHIGSHHRLNNLRFFYGPYIYFFLLRYILLNFVGTVLYAALIFLLVIAAHIVFF